MLGSRRSPFDKYKIWNFYGFKENLGLDFDAVEILTDPPFRKSIKISQKAVIQVTLSSLPYIEIGILWRRSSSAKLVIMSTIMAHSQTNLNNISTEDLFSQLNSPGLDVPPNVNLTTTLMSMSWVLQSSLVLALLGVLLPVYVLRILASSPSLKPHKKGDPPQLPYKFPIIGNLASYLLDDSQLASSIA